MKINKNSLQARIKTIVAQKNVPSNVILQEFFFESFLKRLAKSKYSSNYILKGGCLLSNNLGIDYRSTMDIDFLVTKMSLEKDLIEVTIKEVCLINVDDFVKLHFISIDGIREGDQYGGYKITLLGKLENIKVNIYIDIATGDPITPHAVVYSYKCLFDDCAINIPSYNFETILAEKLQTILSRGITNSRCKDFYDIYIIKTLKFDSINTKDLTAAFKKTCEYRGTVFSKEKAVKIINNLSENKIILDRWANYIKKHPFASNIDFKIVINKILELIIVCY